MTENDYISALRERWPREGIPDVSLETIVLADEAVQAFPTSTKLLIMRGDLIQLGPEDGPRSLADAQACYERAIELEPQCADAWEELGHYHDAVLGDAVAAQRFFVEAERLRGGDVA